MYGAEWRNGIVSKHANFSFYETQVDAFVVNVLETLKYDLKKHGITQDNAFNKAIREDIKERMVKKARIAKSPGFASLSTSEDKSDGPIPLLHQLQFLTDNSMLADVFCGRATTFEGKVNS